MVGKGEIDFSSQGGHGHYGHDGSSLSFSRDGVVSASVIPIPATTTTTTINSNSSSNSSCHSNDPGDFSTSTTTPTPTPTPTAKMQRASLTRNFLAYCRNSTFIGRTNTKTFSEDLLDNACEISGAGVGDPGPEPDSGDANAKSNAQSVQSIVSIVSVESQSGSISSTDNPKDKISVAEEQKGLWKYLGISLTLLSGLLYSLAALIVKLLKDDYHTFMISIWRFQGVFLPSLLLVAYRLLYLRKNDFKAIWPINRSDRERILALTVLMLRGILGCWSVILQFYSLHYLQVSDSMVITSSTSVFVTLFAHCFIGEKFALVPILTAFLTILGVFVISRPPMLTGQEKFDTDILIGVGMALGCMIIAAVILVIQRYLRNVHFSLISLSSGVWGTLQCVILTFSIGAFKLPETPVHELYVVTLAILTFFGQSFIVIALKFEQAGPVAVVQSCDVIFAFLWQFLFLGVVPDYFSLMGSLIIIAGVLLTAFRKCLTVLPDDHKSRRRFRFLLL